MYSRRVTPDKGWAWVICLVTFLVHVTVDGVTFSFGVLFVELTEYFGSSPAYTAWIGALLMALMHVLGIVASSLTKFWGFRIVSLVGAVLASAGFALSFLVTELWQLFFTIGLLAGVGYGFLYFGSMLALQHWFEKRLALANGLSTAGNGIGTFVIAPLIEVLVQILGWRGTLLIIGGIVAQNIVLSLLLQGKGYQEALPADNVGLALKTLESNQAKGVKDTDHHEDENNFQFQSIETNESHEKDETQTFLPALASMTSISHQAPTGDKIKSAASVQQHKCCLVYRDLLDFSVLKIISLDIYLFACFFFNFGFIVPFMFLPDRAVGLGIERTRAALLISAIAASNTVIRIVVGAVGDLLPRYRRVLFGINIIVGGLANAFSIFCTTFWTLVVYSLVNGVTLGTIASLNAVILRDCVGPDNVSKAMGFQFVVVGMNCLVTSPFAGWLYDVTGSYDIPFIVTGCFVFFGGLVVTLIPVIAACFDRLCCRRKV